MSQRKRFDLVKGDRCGFDNCPSIWYTIVDGQYICENGHIEQERYVEEAEVDFAQSQGYGTQHRLKSARGQKGHHKVQRKTGLEAEKLYLSCLQTILREQVSALTNHMNLSRNFEETTRSLWLHYVCYFDVGHQKMTKENEGDDGYDSSGSSAFSEEPLENTRGGENADTFGEQKRLRPRLLQTVVLLYFAFNVSRLAISYSDLTSWITSKILPYRHAQDLLEVNVKRLLSPYHRKDVSGSTTPGSSLLHSTAVQLSQIYTAIGVTIPPIKFADYALKFCARLRLPTNIYMHTLRFGDSLDCDLFSLQTTTSKLSGRIPEILCVSVTVACAIAYFQQKEDNAIQCEATVLSKLIREEYAACKYNCIEQLEDVLEWSDDKIKDYLNMFEDIHIRKDDKIILQEAAELSFSRGNALYLTSKILSLFPRAQSTQKLKADNEIFGVAKSLCDNRDVHIEVELAELLSLLIWKASKVVGFPEKNIISGIKSVTKLVEPGS